MLTQQSVLSVRRIKELIAESEEALFAARAVCNRPPAFNDFDGIERRDAAKAWADSLSGRIFYLRRSLAERGA